MTLNWSACGVLPPCRVRDIRTAELSSDEFSDRLLMAWNTSYIHHQENTVLNHSQSNRLLQPKPYSLMSALLQFLST